jgi:hypothetical protein
MFPGDLDQKKKLILHSYPIRCPVKWRMENGRAVIIFKKSLSKIEKKLQKVIWGPENVRRPLDEIGTQIWILCDGEHTILDICTELDKKHHEKVEPVLKRVVGFLEILLKLDLVRLEGKKENGGAYER